MPLSYIGIRSEKTISPIISDLIIAPLWETLIFQAVLVGIPVYFVRKSWNIPWLPDPLFDRLLKWSVIILAIIFSAITFANFHRPGHFGTLLLALKAKKLFRKMEGAWVWNRYSEAMHYATNLLPVAEELWLREGKDYNRFLQALALYVICECDDQRNNEEYYRRRKTVERILHDVTAYSNDILEL